MEWSGGAGIGVNADGRYYRNHRFSRASNAHSIACLNSPRSDWSNVIYQLCKYLEKSGSTLIDFCAIIILDGYYIPFVELGSTNNINRVPLMSTLDSKSGNVTISTPFSFGSTVSTSLSVSRFVYAT